MGLYKFQDKTFVYYNRIWFLWEPAWESFRPIDALAWNGSSYVVVDTTFCSDPMDEFYGYGSLNMKLICDGLTETCVSQLSNAQVIDMPEISNKGLVWFYDRRVALTPCCPRDKQSWKRMAQGRYKTLRNGHAEKFTRRKHR